ncbi:MAG: phytanoyl-CoA dioxygenase family protein [Acidimicrobiales bacterium]|nr:phytanoyl-CoA dioxygenase family protein [Acidimicrobiales bacterium]MCB9394168.1 phytanoyl-CoA dioxygenase family protein [Acidimicrobiaceae bacterium]
MSSTFATHEFDAAALARTMHDLHDHGVAVVPGVLSREEAATGLERLWAAAAASERRGVSTRAETLDPNAANIRIWNLLDLDPLFRRLIEHPVSAAIVTSLLGADHIVSNFTANIARPGSESMGVHSDQSLVTPPPWHTACAINIIWCFTDVTADNGGTLHVPGSHRIAERDDVPGDLAARMVPFEAPAGSILAMDGRVWHTSGRNVTTDQDRALAFAFLTSPWVRPQFNHSAALSPESQADCSPMLRYRLGLDLWQNVTLGQP